MAHRDSLNTTEHTAPLAPPSRPWGLLCMEAHTASHQQGITFKNPFNNNNNNKQTMTSKPQL